ncbi:Putative NADH-flavin reductase [Fodinibius roseus]|uniref:Putative NADH-flavin reductase n=1 Tax=Fodinibius roseus TaxID=1194090 RepID=A0A1M4YYP5_9BACT|nr:SDR family oxidoreductase [Fodinibius roseus]SHF10677.1 Putative NADH-flavin reductase [Fodinibius roseus]
MKLLVFGATGSIGSQIIEQALEQGHRVTAFSRSASKLDFDPNLETVEGNVLDFDSVAEAMPDYEAVFVALGAGSKGTVRSEGTRNIIGAMQQQGVRRLICLSTLGVGESRGNLNFFWKYIMFGLLLRKAFADHQKQEQLVKDSDLDWTIVRPGAFTDDGLTGEYKHGFPGDDKSVELKISRADVADFMLKQLHDDQYLHKTPGVSY